MPILNHWTRQKWTPGEMVKVGFMNLKVLNCIPTPGDYKPDIYHLINPKTMKEYFFTPHHGLERKEEAK